MTVKTLAEINKGEKVTIKTLAGGKSFKEKLVNLGLLPGVEIEVVSTTPKGPFILKIRDSKIVLGYGMVQKILVA